MSLSAPQSHNRKFKDCLHVKEPAGAVTDPFRGTSGVTCPTDKKIVQLALEWRMPSPDNNVEWEIWTSSDDSQGHRFVKQFQDTAVALNKLGAQCATNDDSCGRTTFTPRYFVYSGAEFYTSSSLASCIGDPGCTDGGDPTSTTALKICTNDGRHVRSQQREDTGLSCRHD